MSFVREFEPVEQSSASEGERTLRAYVVVAEGSEASGDRPSGEHGAELCVCACVSRFIPVGVGIYVLRQRVSVFAPGARPKRSSGGALFRLSGVVLPMKRCCGGFCGSPRLLFRKESSAGLFSEAL